VNEQATVQVGGGTLTLGGWYVHAGYPERRMQVGYPVGSDTVMGLLYWRSADGDGVYWGADRWVSIGADDLQYMFLIVG